MTVWRQMVTPKEDSSGKKSPSLRSTSPDQPGDCQREAAQSQYTEHHLQALASISNSCHPINIILRKEEQKDISLTG